MADFPDVIALLVAHFAPLHDPIHVGSRVPHPRPDELIQIRRVGGTTATVRDVARCDFIAWAKTEERATELGLAVRTEVWQLPNRSTFGATVYRITEFLAPRTQDDPADGTPQCWSTYEIAVRADGAIHAAPNPQ